MLVHKTWHRSVSRPELLASATQVYRAEERTEITLAPSKEATVQEVIAKLPENLQVDVTRVLEQYGPLSHNQLLAAVYEKYPAYTTKSRLRRR